jgi:hypothetical protein
MKQRLGVNDYRLIVGTNDVACMEVHSAKEMDQE